MNEERAANEEQRSRLWSHRLHEDGIFNARQNYFLVAQSMMSVAYATALSGEEARVLVARAIAVIGLLLTVAWLDVNWRQCSIVHVVHDRAARELPEFNKTWERRKIVRGLSSTHILAFVIPPLIGVMWGFLLLTA